MKKASLKTIHLGILFAATGLLLPACTSTRPFLVAPADAPQYPGYELIWVQEFNAPEIDRSVWNLETINGMQTGNNELQHYTDRSKNAFTEDGKLIIRAIREEYKGYDYTSARLQTRGNFDFLYGRIEARIKIPSTVGIWPAFWMMPARSEYGGWPLSGEIDILESVGPAEEIYGTIHYGNPHHVHQGAPFSGPEGEDWDFSEDFRVYTLEWEPTEMRWYVDGHHFSTQNEWMTPSAVYPAPFDKPFYPILNVAVGGWWPGSPDETSTFPQQMEVDWVRVYQSTNELPRIAIKDAEEEILVEQGEPLVLEVAASDPDGSVDRVELGLDREVLATDKTSPYELSAVLEDGCHELTVYVYDNTGQRSHDRVFVRVGKGCPQEPYLGMPQPIVGTIQAQDFDLGIEGEAYHDTDKRNSGGDYRPNSAVDISASADGIIYIGWTEPGEWLEYDVMVDQAGEYRVIASTASQVGGGPLTLSIEDSEPFLKLATPGTGSWDEFTDTVSEPISLPAGRHILRVGFPEGSINLDSLTFEKVTK